MKILLLLPLLLGFSVPVLAHNEANGGDATSMKQQHARKGFSTGTSERDPAAMGEAGHPSAK